jgi:hypothetical protein
MQKIKDILQKERKHNVNNVINVNKDINNNVINVDSDKEKLLDKLLALYGDEIDKPKAIAQIISDKLGDDPRNLNFHIKMAKNNKPEFLFESLSIAIDASKHHPIRNLPGYYVGILKRKSNQKKGKPKETEKKNI